MVAGIVVPEPSKALVIPIFFTGTFLIILRSSPNQPVG
jgi:hypothetical protein